MSVQRYLRASLAVMLAVTMASAAARAAPSDGKPGRAEGVAFLPLTITSDEKGLGEKVRQMLRFKAKRIGAIVYDSLSIKEVLGSRKVSMDTPAAELAALGHKQFRADVVVTGHVAGTEPYEVRLLAVYTGDPQQPHVFRRRYACENHHLIPVEMANAVFDILGMERPKDPLRMLRADPEIDRRWREGPNLVKNPGFEQAGPSGHGPAHWQALENQMAWVPNPDGPGKVLKYDMNAGTAGCTASTSTATGSGSRPARPTASRAGTRRWRRRRRSSSRDTTRSRRWTVTPPSGGRRTAARFTPTAGKASGTA